MRVKNFITYFEKFAPPGAAWDKDNVGLQVGSKSSAIKNILIALEITDDVVEQAIKNKCNFIFTHHPYIFKPIIKIDTQSDFGKITEKLIKNDITLYSAHTNLDFTRGGVSFALAEKIGLTGVDFLQAQEENQYKLVVFVPEKDLEKVADALFEAGAGKIGDYSKCSYRINGEGTFLGDENSSPAIGKKENFEKVKEIRLEVVLNKWLINKVITALLKTHPYEEPAYDIYPLKNKNINYGYGAVGTLTKEMTADKFLAHVADVLHVGVLRYTNGKTNKIKKVAVCGGSGTELIPHAILCNADVFVTADIKYHPFHDAKDKILLVDAGHYETEVVVLDLLKKKFEQIVSQYNPEIKVIKYKGSTNPIKFYKK